MAGQTIKIPATVTGRPIPTIVWAVEEGELDKDRVVIENVGTKSELTIKNAVRKDHGRYVITASNSSGSKSAGTRVEVFGKKKYFLKLNKLFFWSVCTLPYLFDFVFQMFLDQSLT